MKRISVCIAAFNGEKYIKQQLDSILSQLSENDEIVISDDSSTDKTVSIIEEFSDSRIRLYTNSRFQSPIYNFEFCLSQAKGDIIFMSDQDDLWLPHKVARIGEVFKDNPTITLVASDACVMNYKDEVIQDTLYHGNFTFTPNVLKNIIKNRFFGCTLAFRREMLGVLLPFPRHLPMHDSWIGILNQIFGKVYFVNTPLIAYRRHALNFSSSTHAGVACMVTWRWTIAIAVVGRVFSCFRKRMFGHR